MVGAGEIQHRFNRQVVVSSLCQRTDSVHSVCLSELLRHLSTYSYPAPSDPSRADAVQGWVSACQARGIPCNDHFRLQAVLGDPVKVGLRGEGVHLLAHPVRCVGLRGRGASTGRERPGGARGPCKWAEGGLGRSGGDLAEM